MLSSILLSKLPPDMCLIVSRKVSADDLDMETFKQELIARERASDSVSQAPHCVQNQVRTHTSALGANAPGLPLCVFCLTPKLIVILCLM